MPGQTPDAGPVPSGQRKLDYTQEEVRVLKEIFVALIGSCRISFTADQCRRLAVAGNALGPLR